MPRNDDLNSSYQKTEQQITPSEDHFTFWQIKTGLRLADLIKNTELVVVYKFTILDAQPFEAGDEEKEHNV